MQTVENYKERYQRIWKAMELWKKYKVPPYPRAWILALLQKKYEIVWYECQDKVPDIVDKVYSWRVDEV